MSTLESSSVDSNLIQPGLSETLSLRIIDWQSQGAQAREAALRRPTRDTDGEVQSRVARIIDQVRADGDGALRALTRRFDGAELATFEVGEPELDGHAGLMPGE